MSVYKAINAVQADLAKTGIGKDRKNEMQGFKFRGIDDVYNAVSPLLAKHGLCILPRCLEREVTERTNHKGTALFYVVVKMEFDFVCSEDGSKHTVGPMYGEAMDSGDKATNKAMSAAYKYGLMEAFAIPTEGDNDADAQTHEVAAEPKLNQFSARGASLQGMKVDWKLVERIAASVSGFMADKPVDWEWSVWAEVEGLDNEHLIALAEKLTSSERSTLKKVMVEKRKVQKAEA